MQGLRDSQAGTSVQESNRLYEHTNIALKSLITNQAHCINAVRCRVNMYSTSRARQADTGNMQWSLHTSFSNAEPAMPSGKMITNQEPEGATRRNVVGV